MSIVPGIAMVDSLLEKTSRGVYLPRWAPLLDMMDPLSPVLSTTVVALINGYIAALPNWDARQIIRTELNRLGFHELVEAVRTLMEDPTAFLEEADMYLQLERSDNRAVDEARVLMGTDLDSTVGMAARITTLVTDTPVHSTVISVFQRMLLMTNNKGMTDEFHFNSPCNFPSFFPPPLFL